MVLREPEGEVPLGYSPGGWGTKTPVYPIRLILDDTINMDVLSYRLYVCPDRFLPLLHYYVLEQLSEI